MDFIIERVDFEDCLQVQFARDFLADFIITRNANDYSGSDVPAILPRKLIERLSAANQRGDLTQSPLLLAFS